jgi:anti-sigma regulatory factor (Ser/Thr protein kinase)
VNADDPVTTVALDLADDVPPLAAVRRWAAEELADLTEDEIDDCMLLVTELVSNAYDHGTGPRSVRLRRSPDRSHVRIEVDDASPDDLTFGRSRLGPNRGRGLVIVDKLAKDWGVDVRPGGKTVWAELSCGAAHVPV